MLPSATQLRDFISQLTPIADIAAICQCPEMELREAIADPSHELYTAARKAKAHLGEVLRGRLVTQSDDGDAAALQELHHLLHRLYNDI